MRAEIQAHTDKGLSQIATKFVLREENSGKQAQILCMAPPRDLLLLNEVQSPL